MSDTQEGVNLLDTTIGHSRHDARHRGSGHVPLPRGLATVDRLLRSEGYPEPDGWQAVEAVLVGLAGLEPLLVRAEGLLGGFDPVLLADPRHKALWHAYGRVRAAGDDVRDLDVLGAALDVVNPGGVLEYVSALWAEYPSSVGVNVTRARVLLEGRAEDERELERVTERARARGVLPRLRVVETAQVEPLERVSEFAVRGMETVNADSLTGATAVRPQGAPMARPEGDTDSTEPTSGSTPVTAGSPVAPRTAPLGAGLSAARRAPAPNREGLSWCPHPVNKAYVDRHRGRLDTVDVPCLKRGCAWCGPRWVSLHVEAVTVALTDRDAWVVTVPRAEWDTFRKRQERAHSEWDYKRIPLPEGDATLVLSTVEVPGAARVSASDVRAVLEPALEAVRTVKGAKVSASTEWSVAAYRRAQGPTERTTEFFGDVTQTLERFERVLSWWRAVNVTRFEHAGRIRLRATGMTPDVFDALLRNGVVRHPAAVALDRTLRSQQRARDRAERERLEGVTRAA